MTAILIIGVFEALFLSGLLVTKRRKSRSDFILLSLLLIMAFTIIASYIEQYNQANNYPYPFFIHVSVPFIFLHGPLLWFYIKSFTSHNFKLQLKYLLHFIPFALAMILLSMTTYNLPVQEKIAQMQTEEFKNNPSYLVVVLGIAVFTQGYFIWGLVLIRNYRRNIKNYFSQISHIDLSWLRFILLSAIVAYAINSGLYLFDYLLDLFNYKVMQLSSFIIGSLYILFMGFYGLRQTNVFRSIPEKSFPDHIQEVINEPTKLETEDERFIRQLLDFFQKEKPFLQPDITLLELSRQLNVTPEYLSKILNKHLHQHFFDFINQFRVEAFKDACRNPENHKLSIIGMAYDCGFNSKATFNRVFKNMTGITPGNYLKSIR